MAISTTLAYTNYAKQTQDEIMRILGVYFSGVQIYKGIRAIGAKDSNGPIQFPCFMVEDMMPRAQVKSVTKYEREFDWRIQYWLVDTNREQLVDDQHAYLEALIKLFSNNADGSANGTFLANGNFWWKSEMKALAVSRAYIAPDNPGAFMRAGYMDLTTFTRVLM